MMLVEKISTTSTDMIDSMPQQATCNSHLPQVNLQLVTSAHPTAKAVTSSVGSLHSPTVTSSWNSSLEELSLGLQRICRSPARDLHLNISPKPSTANLPYGGSPPLAVTSSPPLQSSPGAHMSGLTSSSNGRRSLRVKHEQSSEDLQRRLSQISGFKQQQQQPNSTSPLSPSPSASRQATLDLARLVSRRLSSCMHNRVNFSVPVSRQDADCVSVQVCDGSVSVINTDHVTSPDAVFEDDSGNNNRCALHVEDSRDVRAERLMCLYDEGELHVRERSKAIVHFELSRLASTQPLHCPVFSWRDDDRVWRMTWFLDAHLTEHNISVRTVDNMLVVVYRSRRSHLLPLQHELAREVTHDNLHEQPRNPSLFQPSIAPRSRGALQLTLELPEGVDGRSVRAHIERDRLLVVQGHNNATFERSMTL